MVSVIHHASSASLPASSPPRVLRLGCPRAQVLVLSWFPQWIFTPLVITSMFVSHLYVFFGEMSSSLARF